MNENEIVTENAVDHIGSKLGLPLKLPEHTHSFDDNPQSPLSPTNLPTALKSPTEFKNINITNNSLNDVLDRQLLKCNSMASTCGSPTTSAIFPPDHLDKLETFDNLYSSLYGCTIKSYNEQKTSNNTTSVEGKIGNVSKLVKLSERISGFERQIQLQAKRKIMAEETKIKYLDQTIARLVQSVEEETNRRLETVKALHSIFETQIKVVEKKMDSLLTSKFTNLQQVLNTINDKMDSLESQIENEKSSLGKNIKEKGNLIAEGVSSLQAIVEEERIKRSQRETKILQIAIAAESKVEKLLDTEKRNIESKIDELKGKFEIWKASRDKEASEFQNLMLKELSNIKNGLVLECQARESADDDIVQALHSYAKIFANFEKNPL